MNAVTDKKPRLTTSAMIASISSEGQRVQAAPFGKALVEYAANHPEVVGMTADLGKYTDLHLFAQAYPDRFFQMGMAEQLLMGAAGGMAKTGLVPFATTYAVFGTRRAYDFIHQVIAEENLNVKICCALPGLTTGYGPSHQATEDLAMMRAIPGLTVVDPCDALDIEQAVPQIAAHQGPVYMRLLRGNVPLVLDEYDYKFELGKAKMLREGNDVLVISSGFMTMRTLEAAKQLEADKINVAVLHCPTIKPLDEAAILAQVRKPGRLVVVAENHSIIGGLGEAIASLLLREGAAPSKYRMLALPDAFLDAGALPTLHDRYGISTEKMINRNRIINFFGIFLKPISVIPFLHFVEQFGTRHVQDCTGHFYFFNEIGL
jgi:transketolase